MKIPLYQVDSFATSQPFSGNPAAVCPLQNWLPAETMQGIAASNNLSETAFFVKCENHYELRWFTPNFEIDLCGHATLAAAYVLFNYLNYSGERIHFKSHKSGDLFVCKKDDLLFLDFPSREPEVCHSIDEAIVKGIGQNIKELYRSRDYLVLLDSEEEVLAVNPNYEELKKLQTIGVIVTAKGKTADFVSRFFVPADPSIPEDPVTGSAHCTLIPFWAKRLNKDKLFALQLSKRGGELFCENVADRVRIGGRVKSYLVGELYLHE